MGDRNMAPARAEFHGGDAMGKCEQRRSRTIIIFTRASPVLPPLSLSVSLFVCPPRSKRVDLITTISGGVPFFLVHVLSLTFPASHELYLFFFFFFSFLFSRYKNNVKRLSGSVRRKRTNNIVSRFLFPNSVHQFLTVTRE